MVKAHKRTVPGLCEHSLLLNQCLLHLHPTHEQLTFPYTWLPQLVIVLILDQNIFTKMAITGALGGRAPLLISLGNWWANLTSISSIIGNLPSPLGAKTAVISYLSLLSAAHDEVSLQDLASEMWVSPYPLNHWCLRYSRGFSGLEAEKAPGL